MKLHPNPTRRGSPSLTYHPICHPALLTLLLAASSMAWLGAQTTPPAEADRELHVVGIYEGQTTSGGEIHGGRCAVTVNRPGKAVTLFLSAYDRVTWLLAVSEGTTIEKVILGGYYRQAVQGLALDVPLVTAYFEQAGGTYASEYLWIGYSVESAQFYQTLPKLQALAPLNLASFHGQYCAPYPTPFVLDAIQDDPRLRANYPQPVPLVDLPTNFTFRMAFASGGTVFFRTNTLTGPLGASTLMPPAMRVVADNSQTNYYGLSGQGVRKINAVTGTSREMVLGTNVPSLSWPMGVAFDPQRQQVLLASLGGEGCLYGYAPASDRWSVVSSMNNRDVDCLEYHAAEDALYALSVSYGDSARPVLYRFSPEGVYRGEIPLPVLPFGTGPGGCRAELVSAGDYLVLLLGPEPNYPIGYGQQETRMYLIDPRSSQVWLTYRQAGTPVNQSPTVQMTSPTSGATFAPGATILLVAVASDADGVVQAVEFIANGLSLGMAATSPYQLSWTNVPAGQYSLTARATDGEGASTISAPVTILVPAPVTPKLAILKPLAGARFTAPANIEILVEATHPSQPIQQVAFLANGAPIGLSDIPNPPLAGGSNLVRHSLVWTNVGVGSYALQATASVAEGPVASPSVAIQVVPSGGGVDTNAERELHVIGVYEGMSGSGSSHSVGQVSVVVNRPGKRITLFLCSYEPETWTITATADTAIEKVILAGYYAQTVQGLGPEVEVVPAFYEGGNYSGFIWIGYTVDSADFLRAAPRIHQLTGLEIASFQGQYRAPSPSPFVIDSVQNDPRLLSTYPQPAPVAEWPTNFIFALPFASAGTIMFHSNSLAGPLGFTSPMPYGMRVYPEADPRFYYGLSGEDPQKVDAQNHTVEHLDVGMDVPTLSWAMGMTFDSLRQRALLVSLGGEGYLYGYSPTQATWTVVSSMRNVDLACIEYHAAEDALYGVSMDFGGYGHSQIYRFGPDGAPRGQFPLPCLPYGIGSRGRAELVSVGDYLVLLLEGQPNDYSYGIEGRDARIYLIHPQSGQIWLTWRNVASAANRPPTVQLTWPTNGLSMVEGATLQLTAVASDSDGAVRSVEFIVNGQSLFTAASAPYFYNWTPARPGQYFLMAKATDQAGAAAFSSSILVTVTGSGPGPATPETLIAKGSVWRYLDNGTDQGTAWVANHFDDSSWPAGRAQLGYGDGDETTIIGNGRYITTYFRQVFTLLDAAYVTNLCLGVLRDDGVVAYLNGVEVFRNNMPEFAVNYQTLALAAVSGSGETTYYSTLVDPLRLLDGVNVVAVEVHQNGPASSDLSFDFELVANRGLPPTNQPPTVTLVSPTNQAQCYAPAMLELVANASDPEGALRMVEFYANGLRLGMALTSPYRCAWNNVPAGEYSLTAKATDQQGAVAFSSPVTITVTEPLFTETLITRASVWQYLDDGSDLGTAWTGWDFDDSAWAAGPAQLGYGDGDEATVVSYGPHPACRYITTYFRKTFLVENVASYSNLLVRVLRDDGAAVYLNGVEIYRGNLPAEANYQTRARASVGPPEENRFYASPVNPALLQDGLNVIAAEVHQASPTSSDLSFDLELLARGDTPVTNQPPLIQLVSPLPGESFVAPAEITLAAEVTPGSSPILWVEFFVDGQLLARDTNSPYSLVWSNVPAGAYVVRSQATDAWRNKAVSTPVTVRVTTPPNLPPVINLVQPTNGAAFLAPASIAMVANAYDPDGQIVLVEFFADATLLGAWDPLTVPPPEGGLPLSPQLLWTNVPAGDYLLTARATDELGATTVSAPVSIQVNVPAGRPVVNVAAIDRLAVEATNDFGAFAITRKGDPTLPLTVYYSLSGTASNGVDYVALPGSVTILAGELTAQITIEAITDDVVEGLERVILTLVAPDCNGLKPVECYQVGVSNTAAVVVISDPLEFPPLPGAYGQGLPKDGMGPSAVTAALPARIYELVNRPSGRCQMTIISQPGQMITIEVSDDLFEWKPLTTLVNTDGVLEFSDPTAGHFNRSFYRIVVGQ